MQKGTLKMAKDIRRDQISQATLRIIAKKGVNGLTTAAIANEVGISEANLYRHFKGKDEILALTAEKIGEGLQDNLSNAFKACESDLPVEKLKKIFMLHLTYIEKNEGIPRLLFSEEMHIGNKKLKGKLLHSINSYLSALESLIKEGQKTGTVNKDIEPMISALMLIGMIQITVLRWSLEGFSFSLVAEGKKMWNNFEKCLRVK
ncbi:MAG: TetR/AcrR family transcriptional regulator [Nitrospirae bacterium]|nr:TetR/AcrR family transcriptional regulator [Nitrospirota bacterium]